MDTEELTLEEKCENQMNVIVEYRNQFGKMCVDYEHKASQVENNILKLHLETISASNFKPKHSLPNINSEEISKDAEDFTLEIKEKIKRIENLRNKLKNTQSVVLQLNKDRIGRRLREPFSKEEVLAKIRKENVIDKKHKKTMTDLQSLFKQHCIVPDVITTSPSESLNIQYSSGVTVELGKELTPTQVKDKPIVKWVPKETEYYTLAMVDPDAPSREKPTFREWHHWLVGNIYGGDMNKGEVLSDYIGSGPPKGTGLHRYVFLVYKQPEKCDFSKVPKLPNNSGDKRGKFSIAKFAQQFKLSTPIAGNFYVAKYDDYVPKLYAKLKG